MLVFLGPLSLPLSGTCSPAPLLGLIFLTTSPLTTPLVRASPRLFLFLPLRRRWTPIRVTPEIGDAVVVVVIFVAHILTYANQILIRNAAVLINVLLRR